MRLRLAYQASYGRGRDEHFCSKNSSAAAGLGYKLLRKDAEQDEGKLNLYLLLLMRGKESMILFIVWTASDVCSVERTR